MLVVPKHRLPRPAAQTAVFRRQRPLAYGLALGGAVTALFFGLRFGSHRQVEPAASAPTAASAEAPVMVTLPTPAPEPIVASAPAILSPGLASAATKSRDGEDRPARKTRAGSAAASSGPSHPREDQSSAEVTKERGILDIGSEPAFAYVSIDGVKVGATPIFGREVTPGAHRIQVWRDGLGSKTFTLEVRPGDRITRVVKFP
jgi:PEGA domain-containing protein